MNGLQLTSKMLFSINLRTTFILYYLDVVIIFFCLAVKNRECYIKRYALEEIFFKKIFILPEKSSVHDGTLSKYTGLSVTL